jgi:hypothetical protein
MRFHVDENSSLSQKKNGQIKEKRAREMIFSRSEINWNVRNDQELARKREGVNHRQLITRSFRPLSLI